jgi:putative DNA primase/helicase
MWGLCDGRRKKGDPMADGEDPGAQGGDAPNVHSFERAKRRREEKERRKRAHEEKMGKGDETRQFGCEMRPGDKKPGLYSISEDGGWIAQLFEVVARGRSPSEKGGVPGMRGIVIAFKNCNGHEREVFLPNALLNGDVGKLTTVLSELGFGLDHGDGARKALKRYLAGYVHSKRIIVAPRTEWLWDRGCRVAFVLPDEVINTPDADDRIILDPNYKSAKMEQHGTFEEWQKDAPRLARKHTLARFRMSAAFAGPLLGPSGEEGGVFNLYGESSGGKSAIDYLTMSVLGRGHRYDGYGQTWSVTANGAEGTFGSHNDLVLFMDDTSTAEPRDISKVIYVSASSQGKTRMTGEISTRRPPPFRLIIMSSGEKSNIDLLKENKLRVTPGFMVRAPDIPAIGKGKTSTIGAGAAFDASDEDWNAWVAEAAKVSVAVYGTALPEFVRRFIDAGIKDDEVRGLIDKFVAARGLTDPHGQVRRVARKFGLIAAAGELAIKLGVLPWNQGEALEAAVYAFELWLSRRGTSGSLDLKQALERIRDLFEKSSEARFDVVPVSGDMVEFQRPPAPNRLGWTRGNGDDRRWHMLPGTFQKEICAGFDEPTLISVLVKKGVLEELDPERGGRPKKARLWPGFRPRCFSFTPKVFQVAQDDADETDDD